MYAFLLCVLVEPDLHRHSFLTTRTIPTYIRRETKAKEIECWAWIRLQFEDGLCLIAQGNGKIIQHYTTFLNEDVTNNCYFRWFGGGHMIIQRQTTRYIMSINITFFSLYIFVFQIHDPIYVCMYMLLSVGVCTCMCVCVWGVHVHLLSILSIFALPLTFTFWHKVELDWT